MATTRPGAIELKSPFRAGGRKSAYSSCEHSRCDSDGPMKTSGFIHRICACAGERQRTNQAAYGRRRALRVLIFLILYGGGCERADFKFASSDSIAASIQH